MTIRNNEETFTYSVIFPKKYTHPTNPTKNLMGYPVSGKIARSVPGHRGYVWNLKSKGKVGFVYFI